MKPLIQILIKDYKADIPVEKLKQKYTNSESKFIEIDGMQVHYRDEGNPQDSVPLVLIHGTSSSLHTWDDCTEQLKKNHRVIRFDIPAFGLTGPNADNDYSIARYVAFVNQVLEKLKVSHCYLAGNSLGGEIAWGYALRHPEKVKKMILLDAAGYIFKRGKGALGFKITEIVGKIPLLKYALYVITPDAIVHKSVSGVYYDKSKVTKDIVERYMDFILREGNRKAFVSRLTGKFVDDTSKIKTILTPTLIIWGDHDEVIPLECAYKFQKDLPNNKLVILKNLGHVPMEEDPEQVSALIEDFISN